MNRKVVLDASAFDVLDTPGGIHLRALLTQVGLRDDGTYCAAVTLAEVCRGPARTRRIENALARRRAGRSIMVVATDERLAKLVGAILHDTGSGSDRLADAHVVAVCASAAVAVVITSDPADITELATAIPGTRVVVRDPATPLRGWR